MLSRLLFLPGPAVGEIALIHRMPMISTDLPFQFKRLQFSIKVSFTMRVDSFSHGQLYVGLSRTGNSENKFILLPHGLQTKNVVYSEILWEQYFKI